jgi:ElaB/YqjD/DUF883 family membrane-anchored ribosome-binding protein
MNDHQDTDRSIREIQIDIERTRERLGETVEALGSRLNPSHVKERLIEGAREATIGRVQNMATETKQRLTRTGRGLVHTIRENPLPAAMIAGGIGWLVLNARREHTFRTAPELPWEGATDLGTSDLGYGSELDDRNAAQRAASKVRSVGHQASEKVEDVAHKARDAAEHAIDSTREKAHELADKTRVQAHRVEQQIEHHPLTAGLVALALGLAVGLSIPATEKEAEVMGAARDRALDKAKEMASETADKVQHVAERVTPEIKESISEAVRDEGLNP